MADKYISHSQMTMFQRCPRQYYYRYERGLKIRPTGSMFLGTCFDDSVSYNYDQKIETERDRPASEVAEVFVDTFDKGKYEVEFDEEDTPGGLRDDGVKLVGLHMKQISPTIRPRKVQNRFELALAKRDYTIVTVADLITQDGEVVDIKTTKKTPSKLAGNEGSYKIDWNHFIQAGLYNVAYQEENGRPPTATSLYYHIRLKTPVILPITFDLQQSHLDYALRQIDMVVSAIDSTKKGGVWFPNRGHMMCSQKQCGFWKMCHEECGPDLEATMGFSGIAGTKR